VLSVGKARYGYGLSPERLVPLRWESWSRLGLSLKCVATPDKAPQRVSQAYVPNCESCGIPKPSVLYQELSIRLEGHASQQERGPQAREPRWTRPLQSRKVTRFITAHLSYPCRAVCPSGLRAAQGAARRVVPPCRGAIIAQPALRAVQELRQDADLRPEEWSGWQLEAVDVNSNVLFSIPPMPSSVSVPACGQL
jgi:hypothetical protein